MSLSTGLIPIDEVVYFDICTHDPTTGGVSDADSTPTFSVYEEATDTPVSGASAVNFTKRTSLTGDYRGSFTASTANGFVAGRWYSIIASATVTSVSAKKNCGSFRVAPAESQAGVPKGDTAYFGGTAGTFASGRAEVNTTHAAGTAWGSGAITAGSIASDAITAAKIADGAIDANTFASGAINAAALATDAGAEIADAVWDEAQSGHTTAGTFGKYLDSAISGVSTGGVTAGDIADAVWDELTSGHSVSASFGKAVTDILAAVDTEIAAIKAKTDNLPGDPADASDIAASFATVASTLSTIASYIDTEVAAIKVVTDQLVAAQAEPSSVPSSSASPLAKIAWIAALARNKITQTSSTQLLRNDSDSSTIGTATVSDDGLGTVTRGKFS